MKHVFKIITVLVLSSASIFAQDDGSRNDDLSIDSYRLLIPELEVLIDSALVNSGMLGYRKSEIEVKQANLKSKPSWASCSRVYRSMAGRTLPLTSVPSGNPIQPGGQ